MLYVQLSYFAVHVVVNTTLEINLFQYKLRNNDLLRKLKGGSSLKALTCLTHHTVSPVIHMLPSPW